MQAKTAHPPSALRLLKAHRIVAIIDNDPGVLEVLKLLLQAAGYDVLAHASATAFEGRFRQRHRLSARRSPHATDVRLGVGRSTASAGVKGHSPRQRGRVPPEAGACGLTLSYALCDAAACLLRALANSLVTSGLKAGMSSGFRLVTRLPSTTTC